MPSTPTVFLVDDDRSIQRGISRLIRAAGYEVEIFSSAEEFLQHPLNNEVGCILLDVQMDGLSGPELRDLLDQRSSEIPIVFMTAHGDVPTGVEAMKKGAVDFLTKPADEEILLKAIEQAVSCHRKTRSEQERTQSIHSHLEKLTPREFEVARCVVSGALNKQIAGYLGISEKTVKIHRGRVFEKMEVRSVAELVRILEGVGVPPILVEDAIQKPCA